MKFYLSIIFTLAFMPAAFANPCETPEQQAAYEFGLEIQDSVKNRDIGHLFSLVDGELKNGPRKADLQNINQFDDIFPKEWQEAVIEGEPSCTPVGWRGYMLAQGNIWYDFLNDSWQIFAINGANDISAGQLSDTSGWIYEGRMIPHSCFIYETLSSDNFNSLKKRYKISDDDYFKANVVLYLDSIIPFDRERALVPLLNECNGDVKAYIKRDQDLINYSDGLIQGYEIVAEIEPEQCQYLAPHVDAVCQQSYLMNIYYDTGGSIGRPKNYGIYGLFKSDRDQLYIAPLMYFPTRNDALNFIQPYN